MNKDLVSIIISLYNKEQYIEETIKNIKTQSYSNWELIIIDDCSTDNSYKFAKKYENEQIYVTRNNKRQGVAKARNIGLEKARGRYICFQDADDLWESTKLEEQIKFMKQKQCAFSYTAFRYMKEDGTKRKRMVKIQEKLSYEESLKNIRILTISVMIDISKMNKELLKMPDVPSEDIATWWNVLEKGYIAYGLNRCLVYYRQTPNSLTSNKIQSAKNRWYLYRKYKKFTFLKSLHYFIYYAIYAIIKRI